MWLETTTRDEVIYAWVSDQNVMRQHLIALIEGKQLQQQKTESIVPITENMDAHHVFMFENEDLEY